MDLILLRARQVLRLSKKLKPLQAGKRSSRLAGILLIILLPGLSMAQDYDTTFLNRLLPTCKVWGYAKYFHTEIAKGNVDWDSVLLAQISLIQRARSDAEFNQILLNMLRQAGEMGVSNEIMPEVPDSLNYVKEPFWRNDPIFTEEVRSALDTIRARFRPRENVYVTTAVDPLGGQPPDFTADGVGYDIETPGMTLRILGLFRYWNIINYFYPYKHLMDKPWELVFSEYAPKVIYAEDGLSYQLAMREFTLNINDSHSFLISPAFRTWYGMFYPPFTVRQVEGEMMVYKALPESGLVMGDIITKVDGVDISILRDSLRKYAQGSNTANVNRITDEMITKGPEGPFTVTVSNEDGERTLELERKQENQASIFTRTGPVWMTLTGRNGCLYGYVSMPSLKVEDVPQMFQDLWSTDAIIFDLRGYPNETLAALANYLSKSRFVMVRILFGNHQYPGTFYWFEYSIGQENDNVYPGKVIILFNENSLSMSELTCMGLAQIPGALKIGSTTAGADGPNVYTYLPGLITATATMGGVYYPDYTETQRIGILPDITVQPTIKGFREGRDEVLETALNCDLLNSVRSDKDLSWIKVYPNPASDHLHYELSPGQPALLEIRDLLGRPYLSNMLNQSSGTLDLQKLPRGIYLIRILRNNNQTAMKIVKD